LSLVGRRRRILLVAKTVFHEAEVESRWEAAPAVVLVIALQLLLAIVSRERGWKQWGLPWWTWLVAVGPELLMLLPLAWQRPRRRLVQLGHRRTVAVALLAVVSVANALSLIALIGSLISGQEKSGGALLLKAFAIWATNVIVFGLWFWELDRGGPEARTQVPREELPLADFRFTQDETQDTVIEVSAGSSKKSDWIPTFVDYLYLSTTNSSAFSPTDTMPLTSRSKILMGVQATAALVTSLLVIARAVGALG